MAGAAVISAVMNAIGSRSFPFAFGGDGASYVVAAEHLEAVRSAAAATATFVSEELGLELRVALAPVSAIREAGHDLRVARFAASPFVAYAMFSGGGVEWAERQMKEGRFVLPPAPAHSRPDLTGLSCRWRPLQSRHGTILSLMVREAPGAPPGHFARLVEGVIAIIDDSEERQGQPVPPPRGARVRLRAPRPRLRGEGITTTTTALRSQGLHLARDALRHLSLQHRPAGRTVRPQRLSAGDGAQH
jgi:hypothetical protein